MEAAPKSDRIHLLLIPFTPCRLLCEAGCGVHARNSQGETPLHVAAKKVRQCFLFIAISIYFKRWNTLENFCAQCAECVKSWNV